MVGVVPPPSGIPNLFGSLTKGIGAWTALASLPWVTALYNCGKFYSPWSYGLDLNDISNTGFDSIWWGLPHLVGPLEVGLILYLFMDLIYGFLEHQASHRGITLGRLIKKPLLGRLGPNLSGCGSFHFGVKTLSFPLPWTWSSLTLLWLSRWSINWCIFLAGFMVRDFLKPEFIGSPTLKVLITTSSKSPSISLKSSQYLSKKVFKVSPSFISMDGKESKELRILLQVINLASNALVSFSLDPIKPSSNPSNHLTIMGPRLERNTLHMRALFLEWMSILWLKWLTCFTRSILPL